MRCCALAIAIGCALLASIAHGQTGPTPATLADRFHESATILLEAQQIDRARFALHRALSIQPDHARAYRLIWAIERKFGTPTSQHQLDALAKRVPDGWYLRKTAHYLLTYDAAHPWAETRARMLETARSNFYKKLRRDGFWPRPHARPLECVLFSQHRDFQTYAKRVDGLNQSWSGGYYSSASNRIAMFNYHTSPLLAELLVTMRQAQANVERWTGEAANDPGQRGKLRDAQRTYARAKKRYEVNASYGNIRQTLHEAAHQLAYNSGIQKRGVGYPMWFSEGLACAFESINPAVPFGPTQPNPSRQYELRQAKRGGHLESLDQFIRRSIAPEHRSKRLGAYAQSWALFHFLYNERPAQLRRYVLDMATQPLGKRDGNTLEADFVRHFGSIERLTPAYEKYISRLTR